MDGRSSRPLSSTARHLAHHWFERHVARQPELTAVIFGDRRWTYAELDHRANQWAHLLRAKGVGAESMVGLCFERSYDLIVALLAIFKAGGAYLPLDPRHPRERLDFMLRDAEVGWVITDDPAVLPRTRLQQDGIICLPVSQVQGQLSGLPRRPPEVVVEACHRAYVIYTSGSTGEPKGAILEHGGLAQMIAAQQETFLLGPGDRVLQFSPISFDASLFEIVMALASGGTLVMAAQDDLLPGPGLADLLHDAAISHLTIPPSVLAALPERQLPRLRQIVVAGEACPATVVRRWSDGRRFFNAYGPTECTVWSTVAECGEATDKPSIGRAIPGTTVHVVDRDLRAVEDSRSGELCLAGVGLARGYLGRAALTAAAFVPNPFAERPGERLYRTGDHVRQLADGDLDFVGRIDHQTKIHGRRIELGEIEAWLQRHPTVEAGIVVVREDVPGDRRLVAYVVPRRDGGDGASALEVAALRGLLAEKLPSYMVPGAFVVLDALPLTSHGKIDRDALPSPSGRRDQLGLPWTAPRSSAEQTIADAMGALLGIDRVGADDGFIELGGHSLLATQLAGSLRDAFAVDVPLPRILEGMTVAQLAAFIAAADPASDRPADRPGGFRVPRDSRRLPLSFSQERIWYVHQINPDSRAYHASSVLIFRGRLDIEALEGALSEIVRRHELLRTAFPTVDGEPVQVIHEPQAVRLPVVDLSGVEAAERRQLAHDMTMDEVKRLFDIGQPRLVRWTLLRLTDEEHHLVQIEHHLIHDGWSFNILLGELTELYRALVEKRPATLAELPLQFVDFAVWQRQWVEGPEAQQQLEFWRHQLADVPPLELPTDRPRPPVQTFEGGVHGLRIPPQLAADLRHLARRQGATIFMMLVSCFAVLLSRWSGQRDFCIGSGVANRRWPETEPLIGMIINNLVLRFDTRSQQDPTFAEVLAAMRRVTLDAYDHQDVPFDRIVEVVEPERDASRNPLFQVAFSFHDSPLGRLDLPGVHMEPKLALTAGSAKFDLNVTSILPQEQSVGQESDGGDGSIQMLWEYNSDLFDGSSVERIVGAYQRFLEAVVADPEQRLSQLPLLAKAERTRLLVEWNETGVPLRLDRLPHQLFEDQARRRPEALALSSSQGRLTYGELDDRAQRLARRLVDHGIEPQQRVAIFTPGSPHMVVALLAVLKAGGTYLPIDPSYPPDRIAFVLDDASVGAVLTLGPWRQALPPTTCPVLLLDEADPSPAGDGAPSLEIPLTPRHAAYVIYTSGSTGRPKGVVVEHRGLLNLVSWHRQRFDVRPETRMTQVSSPAFDASVWEVWPYITAGASLHFPDRDICGSPSDLVRFYHREGITHSFVATPMAEAMMEESWPEEMALEVLQTGGDALTRRPGKRLPCPLVNNYGPTENTVAATSTTVGCEADDPRPSIGRPNSNVSVFVVDPDLRPVAIGAPGELLLGGLSLSRGYLDRPALTAERFVPNPFGAGPGARLYRTGDLVRFRADGKLDFLGRLDHQVKVRGFRIELGEVESTLLSHPSVREAVVIVRQDTPGLKRLVAYAVATESALPTAEVEAFLQSRLPAFMLPDDLVSLPALPLTAHGKLNRRALPPPQEQRRGAGYIAPRNSREEQIETFCAELLGQERVGVEDDFFRLGGNSLLATRLVSRVNQAHGTRIHLSQFLKAPTVAALAEGLAAADGGGTPSMEAIPRLRGRDPQRLLQDVDKLSADDVESLLSELQGDASPSLPS